MASVRGGRRRRGRGCAARPRARGPRPILAAAASSCLPSPWRSIIAADRNIASGLALPGAGDVGRRAVDGLEQARAAGSPSEALGQHPDRAGEHRRLVAEDVAEHVLGEDHVEVGAGAATSCIAALSTSRCSSSTSGYSLGVDARRPPRATGGEVSSTLALSTLVTLAPRARPRSATRAMRSISRDGVDARVGGAVVGRAPSRRSRCRRSARARRAGRCPRCARGAAGWRRRAPRSGRTGRRFANRPEALAQAEQALLGARRVGVGRVPLRARRRRPAARRRRPGRPSSTSSVSAVPWASIEAPPNRRSANSNSPSPAEQLDGRREDLGPDPVAGQGDDAVSRHGRGTVPARAGTATRDALGAEDRVDQARR